ncbi:hypothetical protein SADUNF_Sadunf10G0059100 [Salix dunnii]|uniref:Uncharacterized protein n=1 Tax=Salix dunnii TaxID=1413687 RepID=A0A835MUC1_9ROSI|nr:hypothetical protein SADUNF_Sadunf10G0059100 [Salix dunnii]
MKNNSNNRGRDGDHGCVGFPIHSQVIRIKQEFEKTMHPSLQQLEKRAVIRCRISRQRSGSPLGLAERHQVVAQSSSK